MNEVPNSEKYRILPLTEGANPSSERIEPKYIDVKGRVEHEAILKDAEKCKELGLDQMYEILIYLRRWGSWLDGTISSATKRKSF